MPLSKQDTAVGWKGEYNMHFATEKLIVSLKILQIVEPVDYVSHSTTNHRNESFTAFSPFRLRWLSQAMKSLQGEK